MGDPVTMAMIGAGVGAITNPRKPLQGALLGGALGGFGGAAMGAGNAAATAGMTGASAVPVGSTAGAALPAAQGASGIFANATMPTYAATGGSTGLIGSTTAPVTMMDRLGAMGSFAKDNPMVVNTGLQSANALLTPPEPAPMAPPPGLARGQQFQMEQPMYAMYQQQPISLI